MLDPTKTGVAAPNNPVSGEGSTGTSTLDNLEANIAAEMNLPADTSTSVPAEGTTEVPEATPAAEEPTVEDKLAEATAKAERLSQDNANHRAVLTKLGIDPDSQTAEHLRLGLVTIEDVMRAKQPITPAAEAPKTEAVAPAVPLEQKLINLQKALAEPIPPTGMTDAQYHNRESKMLEVITDLVQANQGITREREIDQSNQRVQSMIGAANDVFVKEVAAHIPEEMKDIASEAFLGAADIEHAEMVKQFGERANTAEHFGNAAAKVAPRFNQLIQAIFKAGGQATIDAINKSNPTGQTLVNPLQPGAGGGTPPPSVPKDKFDLNNLDANVAEHLAGTQVQI